MVEVIFTCIGFDGENAVLFVLLMISLLLFVLLMLLDCIQEDSSTKGIRAVFMFALRWLIEGDVCVSVWIVCTGASIAERIIYAKINPSMVRIAAIVINLAKR